MDDDDQIPSNSGYPVGPAAKRARPGNAPAAGAQLLAEFEAWRSAIFEDTTQSAQFKYIREGLEKYLPSGPMGFYRSAFDNAVDDKSGVRWK